MAERFVGLYFQYIFWKNCHLYITCLHMGTNLISWFRFVSKLVCFVTVGNYMFSAEYVTETTKNMIKRLI